MAEEKKISNKKPIIVRAKRKTSQPRLDALRLEIDEYPMMRAALGSSTSEVEELKPKTILVQHFQTVGSSPEETFIVLRSFASNASDALQGKRLAKIDNVISTNARFEQVCRSMTLQKEVSACRLYDVVQVDVEECGSEVEEQNEKNMASLSLLEEDYAYDFYTVIESVEAELVHQFPLVQVVDDNGYFRSIDNVIYFSLHNSDSKMEDSNGEDDCTNNNPHDLDKVSRGVSGEESKEEMKTLENESTTSEFEFEIVSSDDELMTGRPKYVYQRYSKGQLMDE